jgi:uncharacterized membrane protein YccC
MKDARDVQMRLALQCVTSLVLACVAGALLPFPRPYWLVLTGLIVTANSFGETAAKSLERIVGTVLGLLAGAAIWVVAQRVAIVPAVIVVLCIFALFYERTARYRTLLFWLSLLLSLLFHMADAPNVFYLARVVDTLAGAAIAVLVTVVLLPVRTGDAARAQMGSLLDGAATTLGQMADAVSAPGTPPRDGRPTALLLQAEQVAALSGAEGIEATLLRRPRLQTRERLSASRQIVRGLLYVQETLPLLSGAREHVAAPLHAVAADLGAAGQAIRQSAEVPPPSARPLLSALRERAAAALRDGTLDMTQTQVILRLLEALETILAASRRMAEA